MRALPGRASRTSLVEPAPVTRGSIESAQRQRILRATGELVGKRGYNDVTVERIVRRARVSFKTFYRHFSNKEECFLELFEMVIGQVRAQIEAALATVPDAPWPRQVIVALQALFEVILADPIIARACIVESLTAGSLLTAHYERALSGVVPMLREGRALSPAGAKLPATLEQALAGGVLWIPYQRLLVGEVDRIEALLPEAIEFVLRPYIGEIKAARWATWSKDPASTPRSMPR
jgi:AcrR family transcriptional regulator